MTHIHELIDWTVETYIIYKDRVLLRHHEKYHIWLGVGGHVELDENPFTAAKRECMEEVGLKIKIDGSENLKYYGTDYDVRELPQPAAMNIHRVSPTHEHIGIIYFATTNSNEVTPENKTDTWQWLTKEEILVHDDILPDVKDYALRALAKLGT